MSLKSKTLPYGKHLIDNEDIRAVVATLKSDLITQGPIVPKFENTVKKFCKAKHAYAVNSATSALHISCLALGLGPGDIVWTSANTFVSSSNCALLTGAFVDFVDIDKETFNMGVDFLEEKLIQAKKRNKLPKIVIPVHFGGQSCDMLSIYKLSQTYGFKIIEDASHAIGGLYNGKKVGSCIYSDICVFSFHPVKIITTGEGGMALTNSTSIARKIEKFRSHGIVSKKNNMVKRRSNEIWNYQQFELGLNYRMTDIGASLGLSQIDKINLFVNKRRQIADFYDKKLKSLHLKKQKQINKALSTYHLYPIRLDLKNNTKTQKMIYKELHRKGIHVNIHYIPVYRHPYYEKLGFKEGYCPESEKYFREALSLPIFPKMTKSDLIRVKQSLESIVDKKKL